VAQKKKNIGILIFIFLFIFYFIAAARPVPRETVLAPSWLSLIEYESPLQISNTRTSGKLIPFLLGDHYGYVNFDGNFSINNTRTGNIYMSDNMWAEYESEPDKIEVKDSNGQSIAVIDDPRGYPVLLDNRIYILGSEQNELSEIDKSGNVIWTYDFSAPLTCIDAAAGLVLAGSIDGIVEILDSTGRRIFFFEPGGSRYPVILGCAISRNGSYVGIISGIDEQRFLLLERYGSSGGEYRVIYHEFTGGGFRRPVHLLFADQDRRVIFEHSAGLGSYDIKTRQNINIPLEGTILSVDNSGDQGYFFVIYSCPGDIKKLTGIKFPGNNWLISKSLRYKQLVFLQAPFTSESVFLGRNGQAVIVGGGNTLVSFNLEEK
jgi:hypothetical protein